METSCSLWPAMAEIFCFLHVFYVVFGSGSAVWWWLLVGWSASVSYAGDSATTMLFFAFVFCIVGRIRRVLLCAAGLATTEKAAGGGRKIACYSFVHRRSFMYQHESKSGWWLDPTFGGSDPFRGSRHMAMWGFRSSLRRRIPRCLSIVCWFVQRLYSMSILMCYSRRCQKNLVLRQGGGRH